MDSPGEIPEINKQELVANTQSDFIIKELAEAPWVTKKDRETRLQIQDVMKSYSETHAEEGLDNNDPDIKKANDEYSSYFHPFVAPITWGMDNGVKVGTLFNYALKRPELFGGQESILTGLQSLEKLLVKQQRGPSLGFDDFLASYRIPKDNIFAVTAAKIIERQFKDTFEGEDLPEY